MVGLGFLPTGFSSFAYGISADGSTIVGRGSTSSSFGVGFRWTSGGMANLGSLPGGNESIAFGASSDGSVIAGASFSTATSSDEPVRWTSGAGWVGLGFLPGGGAPGTVSEADAVSADGSTIVGEINLPDPALSTAFRWTSSGGMVNLGFLPGGNSVATAVSRNGTTIVGFSSYGASEAFRWTSSGGLVGLGFLPGGGTSEAHAVSADGSTVVGNDGTGRIALIWTEKDGMRSLADVLTKDGVNLSGWTLGFAIGVSADGNTIVGDGTDPSGHTEAWIATIPEPGTGLLVMAGVLGLAITRRGRAVSKSVVRRRTRPA